MTTQSSTLYDAGTVVAVRIRFSSGIGIKRRPAIILSSDPYHASRADAVVVPLTTKIQNSYFGDYDLLDWQIAGLPKPSRSKGVLQTIERTTIEKKYGKLSPRDFAQLKETVRDILGLR